jgi:hypothetical protein
MARRKLLDAKSQNCHLLRALHRGLPRPNARAHYALQRTLLVRSGSFATELVKDDVCTCPLRSVSDRNIAVPRMNAIAKAVRPHPLRAAFHVVGTKRQISTTSRRTEHLPRLCVFSLPAPGGNRPQRGRRTQLILPVSDCGSNASVRVASNLFPARAFAAIRGVIARARAYLYPFRLNAAPPVH